MTRLLINARYFLAPLLILIALVAIVVGGPWSWTGVFLFGVGIVLDTVLNAQTKGAGVDRNGEPMGLPALQNAVMYFMLPVFVLLQLAMVWRVFEYVSGVPIGQTEWFGFLPVQQGITGSQLAGATVSAGMFLGIGIIYGHELAHTKGPSFVISRLMMGLSAASHFCYAHVYNHHLELAHEDDPATAPRGRDIYTHLPLSYLGQSKFLFEMEKQRLERLGVSFISWQNRWLRGYFMALPTIALFWFAGAWTGIVVLLVMWIISNFELEALNYMEHYGLIREKGQPIDYRHSWDNSTMFTSWFFIEIGRQADHHDRGETHFWELDQVGAPNTGWGYFTLFAVALVPPMWHAYMKPILARWDEELATPGERKIAEELNRQVGYTSEPIENSITAAAA